MGIFFFLLGDGYTTDNNIAGRIILLRILLLAEEIVKSALNLRFSYSAISYYSYSAK